MPDPVSYLEASIAVMVASAIVVLAFRLVTQTSACSAAANICVLAVGVGLVTGYVMLHFSWTWSPANALNRFLTIVLPSALIVELLHPVFVKKSWMRVLIFALRGSLYACVGRILLHDSVYLDGIRSGNPELWSLKQTIVLWSFSFAGLIGVWSLLNQFSQRTASCCGITLSLALAILCTGLTTMMAGYIKGGVAAIPLSAALVGTALVSPILANGVGDSGRSYLQGTISIGVIGLFSLLCIGHYFGQLCGLRAIVIFLTPLLCRISELPSLRAKSPWQKMAIQLIVVVIPLAVVLYAAKHDFDQKMAPLLASAASHTTSAR